MDDSQQQTAQNNWAAEPYLDEVSVVAPLSSRTRARAALLPGWKSWHLAVVIAAALTIVSIGIPFTRRAAVPAPPIKLADPINVQVTAPGLRADADAPVHAPKWVRSRPAGWASDGSKMITFELEAENDVNVWMNRVRPTLAVRCLGHSIETFVVTESAASIESQGDRHTVQVGFDEGTTIAEQWLDSADHHELFAADGAALARKLAASRTMRFGFTPFNALPVLVEFDVRGFAEPLEAVTRACRQPNRRVASAASH